MDSFQEEKLRLNRAHSEVTLPATESLSYAGTPIDRAGSTPVRMTTKHRARRGSVAGWTLVHGRQQALKSQITWFQVDGLPVSSQTWPIGRRSTLFSFGPGWLTFGFDYLGKHRRCICFRIQGACWHCPRWAKELFYSIDCHYSFETSSSMILSRRWNSIYTGCFSTLCPHRALFANGAADRAVGSTSSTQRMENFIFRQ